MFFTIRFNAALAALGINPTLVPAEYREIGQVHGKMAGCTPQEAVLITLAELPMELQMMGNPMIAKLWVHDGKVRLHNPAIQVALLQIGWELG